MKAKKNTDKIRIIAVLIVSLLVIVTGAFFSIQAFSRGDVESGIAGGFVAITILLFALFVFVRGNRDLKQGLPLKDERSRRVVEKASSMAFYVSLYLLLAVGFLSEDAIPFRDVSQATSITVGMMAILFAGFWVYYNRKAM
ncbi:MAG: DUF2178 domain-containing protein [bacterium]|nr:DUF2178 domain-containing protein [bacterium]